MQLRHGDTVAVARTLREICCSTGLLALLLLPADARAGPDLPGAGAALISTPLDVVGNAVGGVGLLAGALLGCIGDGISLLDRNRATEPLLRGALSTLVHASAYGVSGASTRSLEFLRREDVERLPEPPAAYFGAVRFAGRFDTGADGVRALELSLRDALSGPALAVLRAVGARGAGDALAHSARDARVAGLGPSPLPPASP
jgi:hypothetical protein